MGKRCNMTGVGIFVGFMLGLACSTRKGKEFRDDLWEGYRKGGIMGKWKVANTELHSAGQEFINMLDEVFHSPEMKTVIEKGKTQIEKVQNEYEKKATKVKKTIAKKAATTKKAVAKKASSTAKKATASAKKATKKASTTMKRTVKKIS